LPLDQPQQARHRQNERQQRQLVRHRDRVKRRGIRQHFEIAVRVGCRTVDFDGSFSDDQQARGHQHREGAHHHVPPLAGRGGPLTVEHARQKMAHQLELDSMRFGQRFHARIASIIRPATAG
jgi:hypothetical protein